METKETLMSPRLTALQSVLEAGNASALSTFWQEMSRQGTPLIEPIEHDEQHRLVTFLWRANEELRNVVLVSSLSDYFGKWRIANSQMVHLPQTDLWYKTYQVRADVRVGYLFSPNDALIEEEERPDWMSWMATCRLDPLNPRRYTIPRNEEDPTDLDLHYSVLELPQAAPQPWITPRPANAAGKIEMHRLHSTILDNDRRIWVYTPPDYLPKHGPYHLLILFDGLNYLDPIPTPTILDNLLAEERIPPTVAVLIDTFPDARRNRELPCYPPFITFLTQELLPWLRERYAITSEPDQVVVAGSSYGGLAAAFAGFSAPTTFGRVLSQSGAFWWSPTDNEGGDPQEIFQNVKEPEWLTRQFALREKLPLSFYLEVGWLENEHYRIVTVNRHLRDVLQAKGYPVQYAEVSSGHEYISWRGTLADGLIALIGQK